MNPETKRLKNAAERVQYGLLSALKTAEQYAAEFQLRKKHFADDPSPETQSAMRGVEDKLAVAQAHAERLEPLKIDAERALIEAVRSDIAAMGAPLQTLREKLLKRLSGLLSPLFMNDARFLESQIENLPVFNELTCLISATSVMGSSRDTTIDTLATFEADVEKFTRTVVDVIGHIKE